MTSLSNQKVSLVPIVRDISDPVLQMRQLEDGMRSPFDINAIDERQRTAVMYAAESDNRESVELLLATNDIDLFLQDMDGNTVVMLAAERGHFEIIKLLLSAVAFVEGLGRAKELLGIANKRGMTAEKIAAKHGFPECSAFLAEFGKDADARADFSFEDNQQDAAASNTKYASTPDATATSGRGRRNSLRIVFGSVRFSRTDKSYAKYMESHRQKQQQPTGTGSGAGRGPSLTTPQPPTKQQSLQKTRSTPTKLRSPSSEEPAKQQGYVMSTAYHMANGYTTSSKPQGGPNISIQVKICTDNKRMDRKSSSSPESSTASGRLVMEQFKREKTNVETHRKIQRVFNVTNTGKPLAKVRIPDKLRWFLGQRNCTSNKLKRTKSDMNLVNRDSYSPAGKHAGDAWPSAYDTDYLNIKLEAVLRPTAAKASKLPGKKPLLLQTPSDMLIERAPYEKRLAEDQKIQLPPVRKSPMPSTCTSRRASVGSLNAPSRQSSGSRGLLEKL